MKKYFFLLAALTTTGFAFGQQLQTSSFYDLQGVVFNPSTAGVQKNAMVGATYRTQWSGISGSPKTATVFGSFALPEQKIGLGGYIYNDQTGPTSRTGIDLAFAKHIPMSKGTLSFGLDAKVQQYRIDAAKLSESLGSDPVLASGDDSKFKFDAGFGASYTSDKFQVGVSVAQLVQSKLDFYEGSNLTRSEEARLYRHYYGHASYKWKVDDATTIVPNFLLIYLPNAPLEFQGGIRVEHNNTFWWGAGLRANQSLLASAGVNINKTMKVGYSFELYKTPLSVYDKGSNAHELILRYDFLK
jgi:type IX secretion system PorP/SprF family membrane protein